MLRTGALFWLAQSAAALYQGWSLKNPFSCESRQFMTRSTGVSGKSEGEITFVLNEWMIRPKVTDVV